ncbi:MAG: Ig-like domain-containing protein [Blautia sp.]|nr:Ig-like domain-containing protein [Blautia sp.]
MWTTSIPKGTDAGTYYVWYKVIGEEGYKDADPSCIPVTINKKALTITADSAEEPYTGNALTKDTYKSEGLAETDEIASVTITGSRTEVGESDNVPSGAEITRKTESTGTDPLTPQETTGTPESSDVSENYDITYVPGKLKVTKASNTVSLSIEGWTYGDTANTPAVTADFGEPVITYGKDEDGTFTSAVPTNAGTWYVKAEVAGTGNYDGATDATSFTIAKKAVSIQAIEETKTYGESDPKLTYTSEGLVNNDPITGSLVRTEGENVGKYAINQGTLTAGDNYNIDFTGADFTIEAREIGLTWGNTSFTYDGNNHLPTATATNLVGNDVCTATVEGEQKDAGTHTAMATGLSNSNYKLPANDVTRSFTIEKAAAACTPPSAKENLVYSGQAQDLIEPGSTQDGTMQYALGDKDGTEPTSGWASDIPKATNAGTYYVWYRLQGDSNHNDVQPEKILAQIAKKTITVSGITANNKSYDGTTEVTLDFSTAVLDGKIDTDDLSVTATGAFEDANVEDNKTVSISGITLDGSGKNNYQLAEQGQQESATASITAKVLDITKAPEAVANLVYTGTPQTLVKAGEAESGTVQYSLSENGTFSEELPAAAEPGTYTVYYKAVAGDTNLADSEVQGPISVTIAKASGSIRYETNRVTKAFGDPAFTNGLTHIGDGSVTYSSNNTSIVTVDPGTGKVSIIGAGETTITAAVADSDHYTYAEKTTQYTLNVEKKGMTVNAEGYTGSYDGSAHSITVTVTEPADGYTIRYGTEEGTYNLDSNPAITDVKDSKTVYFQVTAPNSSTPRERNCRAPVEWGQAFSIWSARSWFFSAGSFL